MGGANDIDSTLLTSCNDLLKKGIITSKQHDTCEVAMSSGSDILKQQELTETNIFGSSRADTENKYDAFLKNYKTEMDKATDDEKSLEDLNKRMEYDINWIQNVSVEQHTNTEDLHYKQLVQHYNKIDNNRTELDEIQKQFNTLEQKSTHQDITKNDKYDSYMAQRNIMISLIIFLIICVVIIFLLYFI
jgi:hypothetical protein